MNDKPAQSAWPQEMSATSGYLSTSESDAGTSSRSNNNPSIAIATTAMPGQSTLVSQENLHDGDMDYATQTSTISSVNACGDDLDGFSSDSDYGGQSDCESANLDGTDSLDGRKLSFRKRKVASRRAACGAQNEKSEKSRGKSLSADSADGEDTDDYVDIHPVDLSSRLAAEMSAYSTSRPGYSHSHTSAPRSEATDVETRKVEDDDYEEMAPHDPYAIATHWSADKRNTYSRSNSRNNSSSCYVTAHQIQKSMSKRSSDNSVLSSGFVSQASASTDGSFNAGSGYSNAQPGDSPVATLKGYNVACERLASCTTRSRSRSRDASSTSSSSEGHDELDGNADDADHDYTNLETRQEMPLPDVWLARKQLLHDYEDPDYAVAGESSDDDDDDDEEDAADIEGPAYEAGVQMSSRTGGYQSRAGFDHIEVSSEPESSRFAISPPIAHRRRRKNSDGMLHKLPVFPEHPAAQVVQRRSSQVSMTLGLTSRPMSRVESSPGSMTPGAGRPMDIGVAAAAAALSGKKATKSGRSTPTLRDRFSSFSMGRLRRPPSSLSASQLTLAAPQTPTLSGHMSLQQLSAPRTRHSMCVGEACASTMPATDDRFGGSARHAEYDSIASKWITIDGSSPKSKQKRTPFSLLGKKSDKQKKGVSSKKNKSGEAGTIAGTSHYDIPQQQQQQQPQHVRQLSNSSEIATLAKSTLV